jgi:hypothetical protein
LTCNTSIQYPLVVVVVGPCGPIAVVVWWFSTTWKFRGGWELAYNPCRSKHSTSGLTFTWSEDESVREVLCLCCSVPRVELSCKQILERGVTDGIQSINLRCTCACACGHSHAPRVGSESLHMWWAAEGISP